MFLPHPFPFLGLIAFDLFSLSILVSPSALPLRSLDLDVWFCDIEDGIQTLKTGLSQTRVVSCGGDTEGNTNLAQVDV